jgi:hypothetical protein
MAQPQKAGPLSLTRCVPHPHTRIFTLRERILSKSRSIPFMNSRRTACGLLLAAGTLIAIPRVSAQTLGAGDISLRPAASATLPGQWATLADAPAAGGAAV